jgi:hypothetical protein
MLDVALIRRSSVAYCESDVIRVIKSRKLRWTGEVARMWDEKYVKNFSRKPEGKGPLRSPGLVWEDNIKMGLKGTGS